MVKISPQVIIRTKLCFYYTVFCSLSLVEGGLAKKISQWVFLLLLARNNINLHTIE